MDIGVAPEHVLIVTLLQEGDEEGEEGDEEEEEEEAGDEEGDDGDEGGDEGEVRLLKRLLQNTPCRSG
jgi:hypothetical protein